MRSEDLVEISQPPPYNCPTIDTFVKQSKELESLVNDLCKTNTLEECSEIAKDLDWFSGDFAGNFEDCRTMCEDIRGWGGEWKQLAKALLDIHYPDWKIEGSEDHIKIQDIKFNL
tara:strand:- start:98 stop:442 length:345 start_codon:yes stop_codon:yes gene_type:complete